MTRIPMTPTATDRRIMAVSDAEKLYTNIKVIIYKTMELRI